MQAALAISAASGLAQGLGGYASAQGEKQRAEVNSFIGRTRAIQTDTHSRQSLESELGSIRNVMGGSGQPAGVGTLEMVNELRANKNRERRIEVGNRMSEAYDWDMTGKNAANTAGWSLVGGALKSGPSLFDLIQYRQSRE